MRLLLNENIPLASVRALREAGHDVLAITEYSPGITDQEVLQLAQRENRIVVTFDRDYGELIYRRGLPVPNGILYLRFSPKTPLELLPTSNSCRQTASRSKGTSRLVSRIS